MTRNLKGLSHAIAALCILSGFGVAAHAQNSVLPLPPAGLDQRPPAPSSPFGPSPFGAGQVFQGLLILSPRLGSIGATVLTPSSILGLARPPPDGRASPEPEGNCGSSYPIPHARLTCR